MPDGGLLLDLLGIARAHIRAEVPRGKPYCCVQIEVLGAPRLAETPCHFLPIPFDAKVQLLEEGCPLQSYQMLANYGPYWKKVKLMRKYLPSLYCCN